uniref:Secreted protein n=1 Tax=Opuntia streptacantha TaxID=393608 RepID=A0A7C8ZEF7_OPUST
MYLGLLLPLSSVFSVLLDFGVLEADIDELEVDVSSRRCFEFGSENPTLNLLLCFGEILERGDMHGISGPRTSSISLLSHGFVAIHRSNQLQPKLLFSSFGGWAGVTGFFFRGVNRGLALSCCVESEYEIALSLLMAASCLICSFDLTSSALPLISHHPSSACLTGST